MGGISHRPRSRLGWYNAFFYLRSDYGKEEASGSASVVEGRCENLEDPGEGEALGASGGEETASDARCSSTKGNGARCAVQVDQSEAQSLIVRES
jgi:hypothetical protein